MTALNSEGLEQARAAIMGNPFNDEQLGRIISAYLSSLPPVDGLEVVAWRWPEPMAEGSKFHSVTNAEPPCSGWQELVTLSQASSVIAGLKEANEALMRERASLIETKREQIERLTAERDEARTYASESTTAKLEGANTTLLSRISSLEKENKRLRDALEPFAEQAARYDPPENDSGNVAWNSPFHIGDLRAARQALGFDQGTSQQKKTNGLEMVAKLRNRIDNRTIGPELWGRHPTTGDWCRITDGSHAEEQVADFERVYLAAGWTDMRRTGPYMDADHKTAEARIATLEDAVDAFADICDELGCERDNEAGLIAARGLKEQNKRLREALETAKIWHEAEDKALSKQPPSSGPNGNGWARLQHQEQIRELETALLTTLVDHNG